MPEGLQGLALIIQSGGYDRVHYALVLAAGAAATGRPVTLFFTGRALPALLEPKGWLRLDFSDDGTSPESRDATLSLRGVATMEELLEAVAELKVRILACEMGWRALGLRNPRIRAELGVETAGVVTLLSTLPAGHQLLYI